VDSGASEVSYDYYMLDAWLLVMASLHIILSFNSLADPLIRIAKHLRESKKQNNGKATLNSFMRRNGSIPSVFTGTVSEQLRV